MTTEYTYINKHGKKFTIKYNKPWTRMSRMGYAQEQGDDWMLIDRFGSVVCDMFATKKEAEKAADELTL